MGRIVDLRCLPLSRSLGVLEFPEVRGRREGARTRLDEYVSVGERGCRRIRTIVLRGADGHNWSRRPRVVRDGVDIVIIRCRVGTALNDSAAARPLWRKRGGTKLSILGGRQQIRRRSLKAPGARRGVVDFVVVLVTRQVPDVDSHNISIGESRPMFFVIVAITGTCRPGHSRTAD